MEIRKFNVEIRSDGRVYATEYEEPDGSATWAEYDDQKENPVEKIIKAIEHRKERQQDRARRAVKCGDMESMKLNQASAVEDQLILQLIKHTIRH